MKRFVRRWIRRARQWSARMTDPIVMALIIVAIAAIAVAACFAPLRRAVKLDPVEALPT